MNNVELEFRDKSYKLLWFKLILCSDYRVIITFKNGKRIAEYSLEEFVTEINHLLEGTKIKLKIETV